MQLLKTYWLTGLLLIACIVPAQAFDCAKAASRGNMSAILPWMR
jgi:hypothetical protein